jgi:hypothetical protein
LPREHRADHRGIVSGQLAFEALRTGDSTIEGEPLILSTESDRKR